MLEEARPHSIPLPLTQFKRDQPTGAHQARAVVDQPYDRAQSFLRGEQRERRFVVEHVAWEQWTLGFRDVRRIRDQGIERPAQGAREIAQDEMRARGDVAREPRPVARGERDCPRRKLGQDNGHIRPLGRDRKPDRPGPGAALEHARAL